MSRKIFIECSYTYFFGGNTGIQRVVRNLANNAKVVSDDQVQLIPIVWSGIGFFQAKRSLRKSPVLLLKYKNILRILKIIYQNIPRFIIKPHAPQKNTQIDDISKSVNVNLLYYVLGFLAFPVGFFLHKTVRFKTNDMLVLADSTWHTPGMLKYIFEQQEESEIFIAALIHDLFPLTRPDLCQATVISSYTEWFNDIVSKVDGFVTNSNATRETLTQYLNNNPEIRPFPYGSKAFRLGSVPDLVTLKTNNTQQHYAIDNLPGMVMLAVGTIEPRKNYQYTLEVFSRLRMNQENVSLIIVGHVGWSSEQLIEDINKHPDSGKRLLHIDNASDDDLFYAMNRADCLIAASIEEGFGLPVVEALVFGLPVYASDIPSFREIGKNTIEFFDLNDTESLVTLIKKRLATPSSSKNDKRIQSFSWPNWNQSTREFKDTCLALLNNNNSQE